MTVEEMMHRMGSDEYTYWWVRNQIEPIGPARLDDTLSILGQTMAIAGHVTFDGEDPTTDHMRPHYRKQPTKRLPTPEELDDKMHAIFGRM